MNKTPHQLFGLLKSKAMYYWKPFNRRRLRRFYSQFINPDDLCFDIGAHIGNRLDAWLVLDAQVLAVEPQPTCLDYLHRHFGKHPKVTILNHAVGAQTGTLPLKISNQHPTVTTLAQADWQEKVKAINNRIVWDETIDVQISTLDHLIDQYGMPAFCKIDVEGYEAEVLAGLTRPIPTLSFEFFSFTPLITQQCIDRLEVLGAYTYNWSLGESQKLALPNWSTAKALQEHIQQYKTGHFSGDIYARLE